MPIIISIVLFSALMAVISIYGYRSYARPGRLYERLGGPVLDAPKYTVPWRKKG